LSSLDQAVDRVIAGDIAAFGEIVSVTSDRLVRLGARMLGSLADAEDVVQEAYMSAFEALSSGRFDRRASVETWLGRIVTNRAIDVLRRRTRRRSVSDEAIDPGFDGVASAEARIALAEIENWLGALPPEQRAAVTLKALEGRSSSEVAYMLNSSEGAVEQLLVRARATLRKLGAGGA